MCRTQRHAAEKSGPRGHKRMTYGLRGGRVQVPARVFSRVTSPEFMQTVIRYSTLHLVKGGVDAYAEVYGRRYVSAQNRRQYSPAAALKTARAIARNLREVFTRERQVFLSRVPNYMRPFDSRWHWTQFPRIKSTDLGIKRLHLALNTTMSLSRTRMQKGIRNVRKGEHYRSKH